ncbi:MAG: hypothetical protein ACOC2K_04125 [Bacteroidota bacterium]
MKRLLLVIFFITGVSAINAQEEMNALENETQTLFGGGKAYFDMSGGVNLTSIDGELKSLVGGTIGIIADNDFMIGIGGYGMIPAFENFDYNNYYNDRVFDGFGYGGLVLEYFLNPDDLIHLSFNILAGGGMSMRFVEDYYYDEWDNDWDSHWEYLTGSDAYYLVIEPGVSANVNLTKFLKAYVGYKYRFMDRIDNDSDMPEGTTFDRKNFEGHSISLGMNLSFNFLDD